MMSQMRETPKAMATPCLTFSFPDGVMLDVEALDDVAAGLELVVLVINVVGEDVEFWRAELMEAWYCWTALAIHGGGPYCPFGGPVRIVVVGLDWELLGGFVTDAYDIPELEAGDSAIPRDK